MDSLTITTRLTQQDWQAYQRAFAQRSRSKTSMGSQLITFAAFVLFGIALSWLNDVLDRELPLSVIFLSITAGMFIYWLIMRASMKHWAPEEGGIFLAEHSYEFDAQGLRATTKGLNSFTEWSTVKDITETETHIFLWLDKIQSQQIPLRDLPTEISREEFKNQLESWTGLTAQSQTKPSHTSATSLGDNAAKPWLKAIARFLSVRKADYIPAEANTPLIILLALLTLTIWLVIDWTRNQPEPTFYSYNLPSLSWYVLIILAIAAAIARLSRPTVGFGRTLTFVLSLAPITIVALYLIYNHINSAWIALSAFVVLFVYLLISTAKNLRVMSGEKQHAASAVSVGLIIAALWTTTQLYIDPSLWVAQNSESDYDTIWDDAESLLFSQSQQIDEAVQKIAPSDADKPSAFFIGFAGHAEQRVFAEEIKKASQTIGERYGSEDRSLMLVNDRRSLDAQPLANPTALKYALNGVAAKMDRDKDVLFLSLSSHGSEEGTLDVSHSSLMFHDLTADYLAQVLNDTGIKWRVILVSACYSGTFIDPLRSPTTAIITASAADRTSFGCSDDRHLTYFGEAFYRDTLPTALSLRDAFERTQKLIETREKAEDVEPSHPQAFFGEEIEQKLSSIEPSKSPVKKTPAANKKSSG